MGRSRAIARLLIALILRPLRHDLLRTALTLFAVALGVGVVIAIDLAGDAAGGSFESSVATLSGKVDFEIIANGSLDERIIATLTALPINARFCPVLEQNNTYGIDPFCSPLAAARASSSGASSGSTSFLDIAEAQKRFHRYGQLDRILISLDPSQNPAVAESQIRAVLPPGYLLQPPTARDDENHRMLRAFRWNLRILSYVSLVVGAFLIYNTISISVVRRRPEIGILRALGVSRPSIFVLFLAEAWILGIAGSALGLLFGRFMAQATVGLISQTISALYTSSRPGAIALTGFSIVEALAAGTLLALFSAAAPAREAMRVTPVEAMSRGAREHQAHLDAARNAALAALLAILAFVASRGQPIDGKPIWGYVAVMLSIVVAALLSPAAVLCVAHALRGFIRRALKAPGLLAARSLTAALARTSIVVGALATAIAMMIAVAIMVGSFRETVTLWLDTQLRADYYVAPAAQPLPREVPGIARRVPGVSDTDVLYSLEFHYGPDRAAMAGIDTNVLRRYHHLRFVTGEGGHDAVLASLPDRDRVIVSEPFATKHNLRTGDTVTLNLGPSRVAFHIAGIYYDYTSEKGVVMLDQSTLRKYLPDQPPSNLAIYTGPGFQLPNLEKALAPYRVGIAPNQTLRRNALIIFDRTFAITWALEAIAITVAMLGAANSLLALVLDRRRDLGLLQYLGGSASQTRRMILTEAGLLGLMSSALGLALGSALSLLLIYVINKQSFGWTIQFHPPVLLVAGALLLVWAVTVLAGLYPARVAARLDPLEAIHEE